MTALDWCHILTDDPGAIGAFSDWLAEDQGCDEDVLVGVRMLPDMVQDLRAIARWLRGVVPSRLNRLLLSSRPGREGLWAFRQATGTLLWENGHHGPAVDVLTSAVRMGTLVPWRAALDWFARVTGCKYHSCRREDDAVIVTYSIPPGALEGER